MNPFKRSSVKFIAKNGVVTTYKSSARTVNEVDSSVVKVNTDYTVTVYPKHVQANQYNYPTLVGKEVIMFYLADVPVGLVIKLNDVIEYSGSAYKVQSWREHVARGEICLYKIVAVKG